MKQLFCIALVAMFGVVGTAAADQPTTIEEFLEFQHQIRDDLAGGKYGAVTQEDMDLVVTSQRTLARILEGKTSIDELSRDERVAVYNAQETIKAVLTDTVQDTPLCRRQHTVGTHRQVTVCFTPRERREMREEAMRTMDWAFRSHLAPPESN